MKKYILNVGLLILLVIVPGSCSKRVMPPVLDGKIKKNYDKAAFNFVYVEAIKQKLLGNGGDALKYLEQCLKINPKSDATYYQMAQILAAGGDMTNAKKYLLSAIGIDNKNLWYLMMIAGMYYQENRIDSALFYYEMSANYFPDNEKLQITLGNLYSENRNFDKAINIFGNLDKKYGENESTTVAAIRNLMAAGRYNEALTKANILLEQKPDELLYNGLLAEIYSGKGESQKALVVYEKLMKNNPEDGDTQLSLCDFLITNKRYNELFDFLNIVILNNSIDRSEKIALLARIIDLQDLNPDNQNKLTLALLILEANYKDDEVIQILRPELLIKQGKLNDAAFRLEELVKNTPQNYYAWEKLLLIYLQMGDYESLTSRGEECALLFNRSFLVKLLLATGAAETKKFTMALEELRKAEILAGDNREMLLQVLTLKADVYYRMLDYDKAFTVFEEAIKINSDDITLINNYAYYLAEQNVKLKEAEQMALKVIEIEGDNNTYLDTYAWVLYRRGKLKEAAKIMEKILNSSDKLDAEYFEHYGYILMKQRKCDLAAENWNIALELDSTKTYLNREIENCGK